LLAEVLGDGFPVIKTLKGVKDTINFVLTAANAEKSSWSGVEVKEGSPDLLIIGIGESLRADHLGIYGYPRNTTPLLNEMKGELFIYENAYSGGTNTWTSVPAMLTKFDGVPRLSMSIVNLAKDAGYKIYWISNHLKADEWGHSVSSIALQSDYHHFVSYGDYWRVKYDSELIPILLNVLKSRSKGEKSLIVLHFFGSHERFSDRYPESFSVFHGEGSALDQKMDAYDNSVLFTDYVLAKVLKLANRFGGKFIYFSDHGVGNPYGEIPFRHDVRDNPDIDSMHVPLISNSDLGLSSERDKVINLFYFECIFSRWAGITANELNDEYCSSVESDSVKFYDSSLELRSIPAGHLEKTRRADE